MQCLIAYCSLVIVVGVVTTPPPWHKKLGDLYVWVLEGVEGWGSRGTEVSRVAEDSNPWGLQ